MRLEFAFNFVFAMLAVANLHSIASAHLTIDRLIQPGALITWKTQVSAKEELHQLLVVRTVGRNFEGYFRDSFCEFDGTTLPAYSQANGYVSQDVFVFTTDQLGEIYGSEKQADNRVAIKYSCHESSAFQLKEIQNPTPMLHGLPTIELLTQHELELQTNGIKRALSGFREKLVAARRVVETLSNMGEQFKIREQGGFLEDGNIATVWKLSGKEYSKDREESILFNLRFLSSIHEVVIGPEYSQEHFQLLNELSHIGKLEITGYRGDGLKRLPRDKIDSLVLTRIKSNVSEGPLFDDIRDMRSLRALGIIYNHRRAESGRTIPRTPLLRLANLSKLESVELRGEMEGDFEESSNPDFEQCRRLQCVIFSGKLDQTAVTSLSMLPTLRKLVCSISGTNLLSSLQSPSLRSLYLKHIDEDGELIIPHLAKCKLPSLECLQLPQSFPGGDSNFWKRFQAMEIPDAEMKCFKMFDEIRVSHPIKARWGVAAPGQSKSGSRVQLKTLGENLRIAEGRATPSSWGSSPSSLQYNCYDLYKARQMSLQEYKDFIAFTYPYTSKWPEDSHEKLFTERELSEIKENWRTLRF